MIFYIEKNKNIHIDASINWIGIAFSDYNLYHISYDTNYITPYVKIIEGIVTSVETINILKTYDNVDIIKNNKIVIRKRINDEQHYTFYNTDVYDLYNNIEYNQVIKIITYWEENKDNFIYLKNTETFENIQLTCDKKNIAGLASGTMVAEFAFKYKSEKVIFYDYSKKSLEFQHAMIFSSNRNETLKLYLEYFIIGNDKATMNDIKSLDINLLNNIYDNLKLLDIKFIYCDLRNLDNVEEMLSELDSSFTLWISNALYYVTSFNNNKEDCFNLITSRCKDNGINLLPHMRINYES